MCLESIKGFHTYIVQDNNLDNIGFTAGNNRVIKTFQKGIESGKVPYSGEYDWIWLLNNDTTVPKETLAGMESTLQGLSNDVGIVGFQIRSMDNRDLIHHAGTLQAFPNGIHKSGSVQLRQFSKRTYEKWVTFASVIIRREVFEKVGLLDDSMFNYFSDSDFCYRSRAAGYKVIYEPSFICYHKVGQSGNPDETQKRVMIQDMIAFQNKWLNGKLFFDLDKELLS